MRSWHVCQLRSSASRDVSATRTELPANPRQTLAIDACGPFPSGLSAAGVLISSRAPPRRTYSRRSFCNSWKSAAHSDQRRRSVFCQRSSKHIYRKAESHVAVSLHHGLRQTAKLTDKTGRCARPYVLLMLKATAGAQSLMIFPTADCSTGRSLVQAPIQPPGSGPNFQNCRWTAGYTLLERMLLFT